METGDPGPLPTQAAVESARSLYNSVNNRFPLAARDFESRWLAWHEVCPKETTSTILDASAQTNEFEALKRLGPKIIPFVVSKLTRQTDQNSHGVFLYNALENDPEYRLSLDEPLVSQDDLQHRSNQIVELNYQRNKIVEERVAAWKEYHRENSLQSNSAVFTNCEEYFDLLDMGTSIIAHMMVQYHIDPWGYWYKLLHDIIHGRKMGAYSYQKPVLFNECCRWFNEGEHEQAPKYIPTQFDRYITTGEMGDQVWEYFRQFL